MPIQFLVATKEKIQLNEAVGSYFLNSLVIKSLFGNGLFQDNQKAHKPHLVALLAIKKELRIQAIIAGTVAALLLEK